MSIGNSGRDLIVAIMLLPLLEYIMSSSRIVGRPPNVQKGVVIAASFLAAFSAAKIGYEVAYKEPSYYDMLEVQPGVSSADLKRGYKRASLKVHPDKLQAQAAQSGEPMDDEPNDEAFIALKAAYEVLSDPNTRELYDKFGPGGVAAKDSTADLLAKLGFFYIVWFALGYLLTQRKTVARAQAWSMTGLLALAIFEYQATILNFDFLQEQLPNLAMFEKVELLHRLYPPYLLGARLVAWLFFQNIEAHNFVMLQQLHWKVDRLRECLSLHNGGVTQYAPGTVPYVPSEDWIRLAETTQNLLRAQAAAKGKAGSRKGMAVDSDGNPSAAASSVSVASMPMTRESADAVDVPLASDPAAPPMSTPAAQAKQGNGGGRSLTGLVYFFAVYFFFQWLLGRGSS